MLALPLNRLRYDRLSWILFLLVVAMVLFVAVRNKKSSFAENTQVEVLPLSDGARLISERDVKGLLLKSFGNTLEGTELGQMNVERMERVLEGDPFVEDADAYVDQNNSLHVRIRQRAPILRVLDAKGGNYYLDATGKRMPPSDNFTARVMVATGNIPAYTTDFREKRRNSLKDVHHLAETLLADPFLREFIQQIHVGSNGDIVMVPLIGDQKIVLGSIRRLDDKLRRLKIFYQEGMPYAGWRMYQTINLKYNGQVVCRR